MHSLSITVDKIIPIFYYKSNKNKRSINKFVILVGKESVNPFGTNTIHYSCGNQRFHYPSTPIFLLYSFLSTTREVDLGQLFRITAYLLPH